ncbi:Sensory transduction protein regX3 [Variovorax sp. RA8]|nr:Sensory transduction protein regX3 [Variovorax sp. RA8]
MRIAMLDDEPREIESIQRVMATSGHECHGYANGKSLLRGLRAQRYDLLMLDWRPPDVEGIEMVRRLRERFGNRLPLLLTAGPEDKARMTSALLAGADDFMVKPLCRAELQARVHALLRRAYPTRFERELVYGPYHFSPLAGTIRLHGEPVRLKQREYDLALLLFRNIGRLLPREHLMLTVWGQELEPGSRSLDTHMSRLRARLDLRPANGMILASVYGLGYRLEYLAGEEAELPYPLAGATE